MPDPSTLRDSTQIVLPTEDVEEFVPELEEQFTLSIFRPAEGWVRIIGSPVEIKAASDFLSRHGVSVP